MKYLERVWVVFIWSVMVLVDDVFAQSSGAAEERASTEFNNLAAFIVKVMTGPASKILALLFLVVGVWKIVHKDYGSAIGCVLALLALVFMPHFLNIF